MKDQSLHQVDERVDAEAARTISRIVIADDHPLFRQAITSAIQRLRRDCVVAECDSIAALQTILGEDARATLVLLDLKLPDSEGFAGLLLVKSRFPDLHVAIVSSSEDRTVIEGAMVCGACGFIPKSTSLPELGRALATIIDGGSWEPAAVGPAGVSKANPVDRLSHAQRRILSALQRGLMNKQIAYELGVTEATVKSHLTGLFRKLGVQTRTQALVVARTVPTHD